MLHHIAIDLAASSLFGAPQLANRQAAGSPTLRRTPDPMPRLLVASLDFALRLLLYWGMAHVLHKIRTQDHSNGRHHP